jgi:hypothetical protein
MSSMQHPRPAGRRDPITQLVKFGKLEDVLNSQASPEFKATCIEMAIAGKARPSDRD